MEIYYSYIDGTIAYDGTYRTDLYIGTDIETAHNRITAYQFNYKYYDSGYAYIETWKDGQKVKTEEITEY